ncbi:hypothetical protein [Pseudorhodoplanes sp.]|uniref:hypothetical protein n=1 Tax=Pseudorhodoplanes sp. TaxID=1934341 RepID=UPI003D0D4950
MKLAANGRWLDGAMIALLLAASLVLPVGTSLSARGSEGSRVVAVLFAPWVDAAGAMQRVADAGARIVRFGALPFIVVAEAGDAEFSDRIAARGAWMTLDPRVIAACLPRADAVQ